MIAMISACLSLETMSWQQQNCRISHSAITYSQDFRLRMQIAREQAKFPPNFWKSGYGCFMRDGDS